jgi:hypothetical protein
MSLERVQETGDRANQGHTQPQEPATSLHARADRLQDDFHSAGRWR